jgi:hypothetical protein
MRYAVASVRVRAKSILKCVWDVRACGSFLGVPMCDHTFAHFSEHNDKISCFRTSFPVLKHLFSVLEPHFLF